MKAWLILYRVLLGVSALWPVPGLHAAPLAWVPGPSLNGPVSGAATVFVPSRGNVLVGGDIPGYPEYLAVTNGWWDALPGTLDPRLAPGAASSGDMILLFGGSDGTNSLSTALAFSPSGDTLPAVPSLSVARAWLGYATASGGNAYALGGLGADGKALASVEAYNPDANAWTAVTPMPLPRYDFPAVFDRTNQIYVLGGRTNSTTARETASVYRYSTRTKAWTPAAPMAVATAGSAAAMAGDGKIYVVGGSFGGVTTNLVQIYDPAANAWTISTPLPEALSGSAMGVDSLGRLVVMGGADTNGVDSADVWRSQELSVPDAPPSFQLYPATAATFQVPYASLINATGNPQPVYLLLQGPAGMQVGFYDGALSWTPDASQIGSNSVTIRATNYAGYADWTFALTVPHPPPTAVTNLTVVGVTDNSVTLAWAPEDPVVGPTTYSAYLRHFIHDPKGSGGTVWYTQIGGSTTAPTLTIGGLAPGLAQAYYIVASAPGGTSGYIAAIVATTTAPQGPPNLVLTALTSTSVSFSWSPAPGQAQNPLFSPIASYSVKAHDSSVYPPVDIPVLTNLLGTNATVTGLVPGSSHLWFVSGVDVQGNASPLSFVYLVVTNPIPVPPRITGGQRLPDGSFQLNLQQPGAILQTVIIQAASDLTAAHGWTQLGSLLPAAGAFTFTDPGAASQPARFYRVLAP